VFKALFFHRVDRLGGVGEKRIGGWDPEAQAILQREPELANASEELDPGEEEPSRDPDHARQH
jgi:hypothetical protein